MRRRRWRGLLMSALAVAGVAAPAAAAEPDLGAPSVCAPPCPDGEVCVGNRCERPTERSPPPVPRRPDREAPPPPPPGSAPTSGPQPAGGPDTTHPPPAAGPTAPPNPTAPPGPAAPPGPTAPGPSPPPRLSHDLHPPGGGPTYTPTNRRVKRGFLALPFIGIHSYAQEEASAYMPGLRFGSLLGGRVSDRLSVNGELIFDFSNVRGASSSFSETAYHVVFSPLLDFAAGPLQLVFGPKLGIFILRWEQSDIGVTLSSEKQGWSAGLNGGLFIPVSAHTSIGVLLSFDFAGANQSCFQPPGRGASCGSEAAHGGKVLGLTGGVLF